jgi:heme oxygenase
VSAVSRLLRERTLLTHGRVEAQLDLLDAGLTTNRVFSVIERFWGFWAVGEAAINEWAAAHLAEADALQWPRRRRAHLFAQDLTAMGMEPGRLAMVLCPPPVFVHLEQAQVLGWLYVTEGSTLGGALIDRHVRSLSRLHGSPPCCFTPYSEGPGPMWRSFRAELQHFAGADSTRTGAVIDAAAATFDSLERWLVPLAAGTAP